MVKKVLKFTVCFATSFSFMASPLLNEKILPKLGLEPVDIVSRATGGGAGIAPTVRPTEDKEIKGSPIDEKDRELAYESDFVENIEYNNEYGYLILSINPDFLNNGFVNQIKYIGIGDTKYEYGLINTDKSRWFQIFIPYKYVEKGLNDFYFYMDDITYKVAIETSDEFEKKLIAPKLIPEENVDGVDVAFKVKLVHENEESRSKFYENLGDDLKSKVDLTEIFTYGGLQTRIKEEDYDLNLDKDTDMLTIQFKNNKSIYQGLYVYRLEIRTEDFAKAWADIILFEHKEPLKMEWKTDSDNSLHITYAEDKNSLYLKEVSKVELLTLDDENKVVAEKVLEKDKDYTSTYDEMSIKASAFESNKKYKLRLTHPSVETIELELESPNLNALKPAVKFYINDITHEQNLVINLTDEQLKLIKALSKAEISNPNGQKKELRNIDLKAKDDADNEYEEDSYSYSRRNPNVYYSLDEAAKTLTIDKKYFSSFNGQDSGRFRFTFSAPNYEDSKATVYRKEEPSFFSSEVKYANKFATDKDFALEIFLSDDNDNWASDKLLRAYINRRKNYDGPEVYVKDEESGEIKELEFSKDFESVYMDGNNRLRIFAKNFEPSKKYTVVLRHYDTPSYVVEHLETPAELPANLKDVAVEVPNIIVNQDLKIKSSEDFINNLSSITIRDERGFNITLNSFQKEKGSISIPFKEAIENGTLQRTTGDFNIELSAKGYNKVSTKFTVKVSDIQPSATLQEDANRIAVDFLEENLPVYDYSDYITSVELNGTRLSLSQYTKYVLGRLFIQDRILVDGENDIKITSSRYNDIEFKFNFDNKKLRLEKEALLEEISSSKLNKELTAGQLEDLKAKVEAAKTLRDLRSTKIDFRVSSFGIEKTKSMLKEELLKKIAESKLSEDKKKELQAKLDTINTLPELNEFEEKLIAEIEVSTKKDSDITKDDTKSKDDKVLDIIVIKNEANVHGGRGTRSMSRVQARNTLQANKWIFDGKNWKYVNASLSYERSTWKQIDGSWYYFDKDGNATTGWQFIDNKWYYMNEDCKMQTSWVNVKGDWYYLGSDGAMLSNTTSPDGYRLDINGKYIK